VSAVVDFHRPLRIAVRVDDVADASIVSRLAREVRHVFRHIVGGWQVSVRASARGRWRLELSGASGRHVWLFAASAATLPAEVADKLAAFLRNSAASWRPLPL
jgi:hypothetical protein